MMMQGCGSVVCGVNYVACEVRTCPSVCPSILPTVCLSVGLSVLQFCLTPAVKRAESVKTVTQRLMELKAHIITD